MWSLFPIFQLLNMYRLPEIQKALSNLIGWAPSFDPDLEIDQNLTESESGLVYQAAHPLMTLENIANTMPTNFLHSVKLWQPGQTYREGEIVNKDGELWRCKEDVVSSEIFTAEDWEKFSLLSHYLNYSVSNSIANMAQTFVRMKKLESETKSLLDHKTFFDGAGRLNNTTPNRDNIVGFEITPVRTQGVTTKIEKVGLQLSGPATIDLYLFHSSQPTPIKSARLKYTKEKGGFQWFALSDFNLPYVSDDTGAGGSWYLVYSQENLGVVTEAINVSKDWSREPCSTCNVGSVKTWREMNRFIRISPFKVRNGGKKVGDFNNDFSIDFDVAKNSPELWDLEDMVYTHTSNYGLNFQISIGCDLTDFIISQRHIFQDVLQKQVAYDMLRYMAMNPNVRVNRNQFNVSQMDILYELDGNTSGSRPSGLGYELKKSYEALSLDTKGMDKVCLTCRNGGVRYKST